MSDHCTEIPASLTHQIKNLLLGDDPTKAVELLSDDTYLEALKDSSWSIVDIVTSNLTIENATKNVPLFKSCETILCVMSEKCKPSETILELLEHMENEENDVKFCALLKPLKQSLERLENKSKCFDWCMNTIKSYVENLPFPEQASPAEEADLKLRENRIIDVYTEILSFLKPFVEEVSVDKKDSDFKNYLLSLLLSLLGTPFSYLPLSSQSEAISESIVDYICKLTEDCFRFVSIVADRDNQDHKLLDEASNSHLFESTCQVSDVAYANFYYSLMTNKNFQNKIQDSESILLNCLYLACSFLENCELVFVSKGLSLVESVLLRAKQFSLRQQELSTHLKLFSCLTQIMIYCESTKERKRALEIFKNYVDLFTMEARYQVILELYKMIKHSGLLSIISLMVKNSIIKCLEENPPSPYFLGPKLHTLLSSICELKHGCMTDLVEIAEEIIAALNLIRYLAIRDSDNETGFWDYAKVLEKKYLKELRTGIDLSRAHWKLKLKDLEERKSKKNSKTTDIRAEELSIRVGGEILPMMPLEEKIMFSHQALNAFDMMESVLVRVNECLESHRLKSR